MASIQQERKVLWYDPITGRRRSKWLSSRQEALRFVADREREAQLVRDGYLTADQVEAGDKRREPLAHLLAEYNDDRAHRGVTPQERRRATAMIEAVMDRCRFVVVRDVDVAVVKRALKDMNRSRSWSASTFNAYRNAFSGFCNWLANNRYLSENPMGVIDLLDAEADPKRPSRALTVAETDAIINAATDQRRKLLYRFRFRTGLRGRECTRIVWGDLDLADSTLTLRPGVTKNRKPDRLPIASDLHDALVEQQAYLLREGKAPAPSDLIFPTIPTRPTWKRDLDRAGVTYRTRDGQADPKATRKTFESHLKRSGADLLIVMLLMRHTPRGGLRMTLGPYVDEQEILRRKRDALGDMTRWIDQQRAKAAAVNA